MKKTRSYTMRARAAATEATRRRILETVVALLKSRFRSEIRLEDIAEGAHVTVQTIINVFGSRSQLLDMAFVTLLQRIREQRFRAEPGDLNAAVRALLDHYEQFGDLVVRNLAERADPELIATGRTGHRQWVQRQFAAQIERVDPARRRSLTDELVCACDVYTWKLLRRDIGRSRPETEKTILSLVNAIAGAV
ncbi:MAG TPA: TetR/AcrR family transcriptional regulator [Xanthobacteraceae bacterium]|nr:TetR/AcrR family transcriptional regulator [Xanthobacteraceae bacterium]